MLDGLELMWISTSTIVTGMIPLMIGFDSSFEQISICHLRELFPL